MGRSKKLDRVIAQRVQALRESNGTFIVNGRALVPGTEEYENQLWKLARQIGDEELGGPLPEQRKPRRE